MTELKDVTSAVELGFISRTTGIVLSASEESSLNLKDPDLLSYEIVYARGRCASDASLNVKAVYKSKSTLVAVRIPF